MSWRPVLPLSSSSSLLLLFLSLGSTTAQAQALEDEGAAAPPSALGAARNTAADLSLAAGVLETASPAAGDDDDENDDDEESAASAADLPAAGAYGGYVLPTPPALTALGNSGESFDEPSTPSDFTVVAGTFFDENGELQAGGAVEVGAKAFGLTRSMTHARYRSSPVLRLLTRTHLSAATSASSYRQDLLMAVGFRSVLLDGADPLLAEDYREATERAVAACESLRAVDLDQWAECLDEAYRVEAS